MVEVPDSTTRYIQSDSGKPTKDLFNWMRNISQQLADILSGTGGGLFSSGLPSFSAHKNGTPQTVATGIPTLVTWPTAAYDVGSYFNTSTSLWTPPAGKVLLTTAAICTPLPPIAYSFTGGAFQFWSLLKNGSIVNQSGSYEQGNSNGTFFSLTVEDAASGTDTYGVQATFTLTGASAQIQGPSSNTWFMGHWISP